jgi:triacylglycerol lipase
VSGNNGREIASDTAAPLAISRLFSEHAPRMTPIVLQHGLFGFTDLKLGKLKLSYFHRIDSAIADRGHPLIVSRVHPTSSIELRARQLKTQIILQLRALKRPKDRVIIIAHSMGGLDARYMISKLRMADRVAALITISTPHRGSPYADWCMKNLGKRLGGLKLVKLLRLDLQAIRDLTREACEAFNNEIEDSPEVRYFSVSGARPWHRMPPMFLHSHKIIADVEGPNDGMVSVKSAAWGEHLDTWPCDHLHIINRKTIPELGRKSSDICGRYLKLLDQLAEEGLVQCPAPLT